jgi:hypothetical protein
MDQLFIFSAEKGHVEGEKDADRSAGKSHGQAEENGVSCDSPLIGVREELTKIEKTCSIVGPGVRGCGKVKKIAFSRGCRTKFKPCVALHMCVILYD